MGGFMGAIRGGLAGINDAAGNDATAQQLTAANDRAIALKNEQRSTKLGLLLNEWNNTTDPSQRQAILQGVQGLYPDASHGPSFLADLFHHHHKELAQRQAPAAPQGPPQQIDATTGMPKVQNPAEVLQGGAVPQTGTPDLGAVSKAPTAADAWKTITSVPSPAQTAMNLEQARARAMAETWGIRGNTALSVQELRNKGSRWLQAMDATAEKHGYADFSSVPDEKKQDIIQEGGGLLRALQKPTYQWNQEGQLLAIRPTADGGTQSAPVLGPNGQPISKYNPVKVTKKDGFYTFTDADGAVHQVPISTESRTMFEPMVQNSAATTPNAPQAPVSSNTPQVPGASPAASTSTQTPNPPVAATNQGAINDKLNKKKSQSRQVPTSTSTPSGVPGFTPPKGDKILGYKESPEAKLLGQQWNKAAEDATMHVKDWDRVQGLLNDPNRKTDLDLVFAWVRSNVQGAGRMTNTEIQQAMTAGSYGQRIKNAFDVASTGRLDAGMEQQFMSDIQRAYQNSKTAADDLKAKMDAAIHPGKAPVSSATPAGPGADPKVMKFNPATGKLE